MGTGISKCKNKNPQEKPHATIRKPRRIQKRRRTQQSPAQSTDLSAPFTTSENVEPADTHTNTNTEPQWGSPIVHQGIPPPSPESQTIKDITTTYEILE